jgi:hypothetical protein
MHGTSSLALDVFFLIRRRPDTAEANNKGEVT